MNDAYIEDAYNAHCEEIEQKLKELKKEQKCN